METNTSPNHIIDNPNLPPLTPTLLDQEVEWELRFHKCNIIFIYLIKLELVQ